MASIQLPIGETVKIITSGTSQFRIKRDIRQYDGRITSHTYLTGGDYYNCVTISYRYENNQPVKAFIPHLLYEPECSVGSTLERGGGSEKMIKSALQYAYNDIPSIPVFYFSDMSKIDCLPKDLSKPPERKIIKPLNLAYFSIAYYSKTWYELRFNAKMEDDEKYKKYKEKLVFLVEPSYKVSFIDFVSIIQQGDSELISYIKEIYEVSDTYRDFFNNIPKAKRCDILYPWLNTFIEYYIDDVYDEKGWIIDIRTMNATRSLQGGYTRRKKRMNRKKQLYRIYDYKNVHSL
jgi:hypothetical protein